MIKKKAAFSEYRDLEQSYMQLNHCLKKFHQIRAKVSQQLAEGAAPKKAARQRVFFITYFHKALPGLTRRPRRI